jgi:hypothetical protein
MDDPWNLGREKKTEASENEPATKYSSVSIQLSIDTQSILPTMIIDCPYVTSENVMITTPSHAVEQYLIARALQNRHHHSTVSCSGSEPLDPSTRFPQ